MTYGVQLYSVRDITQTDMRGALEAIAAQGYASVEFAGFSGASAQEITQWLTACGLTVSGAHVGLKDILESTEETIAFHQAIGNTRVIIPWADLCSQENIDSFVHSVNALTPRFEKAGIRLGYHNHADEFKVNPDGSMPFEQLVYRTALELEIDTFWVYAAGVDPIALLDRLCSRVPLIHIKDGHANGEGTPLGKGEAPVKAVYEKARAFQIPMIVESETLTPDGLTETDICIRHLKMLESTSK